ncbi:Reverse transcriptase domain-containing protein [Mycena indigotica]|uniref:Reverse transcriptase domain-containing protein n=1 Tax=Mycena indigotica TaxID=2126181 RepID=A0A8H6SVS2_9AGAR|nr:Reverse transcriptase domain-containing protein [Mycena indigotica]KAF7306188.1 Reverse transcriptase domain-containing protein [Mycena indigotica]
MSQARPLRWTLTPRSVVSPFTLPNKDTSSLSGRGGAIWITSRPFGPSSSPGVFGRIADAIKALYIANNMGPLKKWVDDFLFFRFPPSAAEPPGFRYGLDEIYALADTLGWPWKPSKTRPFAATFRYIGFIWDLTAKTVEIPAEKKARYITKLEAWTRGARFSRKEAESVLGTLVHCSLALPEGRSRLPAISSFAASFAHSKSSFSKRTPNATVLEDLAWWRAELANTFCGSALIRPPAIHPVEFYVDASTSFGIGVIFDGVWQSWQLRPGWKAEGRDIGWAEMLAIELGLRLAIHRGFSDTHFKVNSDNEGVIGALDGGKSRNPEQNRILRRIVSLLRSHSLWVTTTYIPSALNVADRPSRGLEPEPPIPKAPSFTLPFCIREFLY